MRSTDKPALAALMGVFSGQAQARDWQNLESYYNPDDVFREVHIVSLDDDYPYDRRRFGTLHVYPIRPLTTIRGLKVVNNVYAMAAGLRLLAHIVAEHRIDLVAQTYGGPLKYGVPVVFVAQRAGLPSVITLHSDYRRSIRLTYSPPLRWASKLVWPYLFRNCTRVRSVSHYVAEFAYEHGVPREHVATIPNKEVLDTFQTAPSQAELEGTAQALELTELIRDAVAFLTVGRLVEAKNLERTLRAFARVARRHPNVVYLIAGDGPLQAELEALVHQLGVADRVRFLGFVPHEQLRCVYRLSDVFLFATLYEGQPRVVPEALLSNLPVICADFGQVCEVVEDGRDGLWVDPHDEDAIADAMSRLASDLRLRRQLSQHPQFDPAQFSIERVGAREADFYLSTIRAYRRQHAPSYAGEQPTG